MELHVSMEPRGAASKEGHRVRGARHRATPCGDRGQLQVTLHGSTVGGRLHDDDPSARCIRIDALQAKVDGGTVGQGHFVQPRGVPKVHDGPGGLVDRDRGAALGSGFARGDDRPHAGRKIDHGLGLRDHGHPGPGLGLRTVAPAGLGVRRQQQCERGKHSDGDERGLHVRTIARLREFTKSDPEERDYRMASTLDCAKATITATPVSNAASLKSNAGSCNGGQGRCGWSRPRARKHAGTCAP